MFYKYDFLVNLFQDKSLPLLIVSMSSPIIGNTYVVRSCFCQIENLHLLNGLQLVNLVGINKH